MFTKSVILRMHERLIERFGGSHGVLSDSMLESTIGSIETAYHYGLSPCELAAKYFYKFIQNHCFRDGNKRMGPALGLGYIRLSGGNIRATPEEATALALAVAGEDGSNKALYSEETYTQFEIVIKSFGKSLGQKLSEEDVVNWFEARVTGL